MPRLKMVLAQANLALKGGAEFTILKIAQHYNTLIYTAEYDRNRTYDGFKEFDVRTISKGGFTGVLPYGRMSQGLDYGLSFYNFKVKEDYDVINAHIGPSHWIRNNNERVMWHCHTPMRDIYDLYEYRMMMRSPLARPVYRLGTRIVKGMDQGVVKRIEKIVTNSEITLARIKKYYNRGATIVGTGVDWRDFKRDGDGKYFFYPSRFSPNKRQDYAIRAFQLFKKRTKGYRLVLCGVTSKDQFYYNYYKRVKEQAAKVGDVTVLADISEKEKANLYSRATAVLFTSVMEDMGLVPLEAMASGKPVISVNEGGPTISVKDGRTGFLVGSETEMARRMQQIADDESLAERLGKAGLNSAKREWSWESFFKRYDAAIRGMRL
ncbi:MAG: glycosyltransferase family 4 protein [Candidatus Marsarchaeota archaeon]|jgi:glycosyltransferase involved in cell wall biosynthesis|nr:glycosyltransferase family 4 protein [Candidatus Marsarchaeota archaeon]MCL5111567.1 glycosyltransferase family 4 protein [Candidatus Marsarchaeota archaeon]